MRLNVMTSWDRKWRLSPSLHWYIVPRQMDCIGRLHPNRFFRLYSYKRVGIL